MSLKDNLLRFLNPDTNLTGIKSNFCTKKTQTQKTSDYNLKLTLRYLNREAFPAAKLTVRVPKNVIVQHISNKSDHHHNHILIRRIIAEHTISSKSI